MKRLLILTGFLVFAGSIVKADELSSTYDIIRKIHYENSSVTTSTQIIAIDVSNVSTATTAYPHTKIGSVGIARVNIRMLSLIGAANISSGTIQLGVVTYVGDSTGTVKWFANYPYLTTSSSTVDFNDLLAPLYERTYVSPIINSDGNTPWIGSNTKTSGSTSYQDDVNLPTALGGSAFPAVNDIILNVSISAGTIGNFIVDLFYHGVRP